MCGLVAWWLEHCQIVRIKRSQDQILAISLSGNNLGLVVHTRASVTKQYFGTGQQAVMPCGWEGNHRSGVALAMPHKLQWFIHLRAHSLRKGDEHPAYTSHRVWHSFTYYFICRGTACHL